MRKLHLIALIVTGGLGTVLAASPAYADHVDRHIWIETAEGGFIAATETALHAVEERHTVWSVTHNLLDVLHGTEEVLEQYLNWARPHTTIDGDTYSDPIRVNGVRMIDQRKGDCGDRAAEEEYYKSVADSWINGTIHQTIQDEDYRDIWYRLSYEDENGFWQTPADSFDEFDKPLVGELRYKYSGVKLDHQRYHENVCGYWYSNVVKDEYTYTIIGLPRDREIPADYDGIVRAGVAAGLNAWAKINDMNFTYTDSRLEADIIVQQQIGNGKMYGNAELGCLFDHEQCTIQLFPDINVGNQQTLTNKHSIAWTVAHEFGHMIGLPHHIDPDHIMNTVHDADVRTYYEARNINVVQAPEPTYEQRLLGYEGDGTPTTDYTDVTQLLEHEVTIGFIEFVKEIAANAGPSVLAEYIDALVARITN